MERPQASRRDEDCIEFEADGVLCVIDRAGGLRFANAPLRLVLGLSLLQQPRVAIHPHDAARLAELVPGSAPERLAVRFPNVAGGWVCVELDCHALGDGGADGDILCASPGLSQRSPRAALSPPGVGVYMLRGGRFTYVSPVFAALTGYEPRELVGMRALDLVLPEDRRAVVRNAARVLAGDRWLQYEYRIQARDGRVRRLTESLAPLSDLQPGATLGVCVDVTSWHAAAQALQRGGARLQKLNAAAADMLALTGPAGRFLFVNETHAEVLGYSPRELLGVPAFDLVHPGDLDRLDRAIHNWGEDGALPPIEIRAKHQRGHWIWLETKVETIRDPHGGRSGTVIISRETTLRRRVAQELQMLAQELLVPTESLAAFAYEVARGQGSALPLISAYAQLLARNYEAGGSTDIGAFITAVGHQAVRLQALVADLLAANETEATPMTGLLAA